MDKCSKIYRTYIIYENMENLEVETNLYLDSILPTRSINLRIYVKIHSLLISKYVRYKE